MQRGKQVARERRYGYDRTGNLLQINDSVQGEQHYRYDPLDRLLEVRGELTERFLHDPAGNLLSQTLGSQFDGARTQGTGCCLVAIAILSTTNLADWPSSDGAKASHWLPVITTTASTN